MPLDGRHEEEYDPFSKYNGPGARILFPVAERRIGWQTRENTFEPVTSHKAIIRMTPDGEKVHVLNVVGSSYKLIHNRELFGVVEDTMRKEIHGDALRGVVVEDKVAGWGKLCYRQYVFPNIKCKLKQGARSDIAFRLIVQNGYGGSALRVHAGAIEFWCSNGMITGEYQSTYHKHTSGVSVQGIGNAVHRAVDAFVNAQDKWVKWSETPVKHEAAMELFRELATSTKLGDRLINQYMEETSARGHNLWAVYSALTFYASHAEDDFKLRDSVIEQDTVASTMLQRELTVAKWIESDAWHKLEVA